jgi:hypothetical protein
MVKIGKLAKKFENPFSWDDIPKKMVKQITYPKRS